MTKKSHPDDERSGTPRATRPRALLEAHGLIAKKGFGQNFLSDPELCRRIAEAALGSHPGASVLEVGPGLGALTAALLERAERVVAIEKDRDLVRVLEPLFDEEIRTRRLELVLSDVRDVDLREQLLTIRSPRVVCGNLPYLITGNILRSLCAVSELIDRAALMVQAEVALRLCAAAGSEAYGALSVFVQARFQVERCLRVRAGAFFPRPKVESEVVALVPLRTPLAEETNAFRDLVHAAFQQRRKKLRSAWKSLFANVDDLARAAELAQIDLDARGETLTVSQFAEMAQQVPP